MNGERTVSRLIWKLHRVLYGITYGRIGEQFGPKGLRSLLLTTTGHRTGKPRSTPLFYLADGERLVVVASNLGSDRDPAWWRNLQAESRADVRLGRERRRVHARAATPEERARYWPQFAAAYPGYTRYEEQTERPIPIVVLDPAPGSSELDQRLPG